MSKHGHVHGEAFCLMAYACTGKPDYSGTQRSVSGRVARTQGCGHRETFWNSRDGVTPFGTRCPSCGGDLMHTYFNGDVYAPDHKPHTGQGIWRDGTPDEARRFMVERIAKRKGTPYELTPEKAAEVIESVLSDEHGEFQKGWPMFERFGYSAKDPT